MEQTSHFNWTWLVITLVTIPVVECNAKAPDPIYQAPPESPNPGECWRDGDVASEADMERMFLWYVQVNVKQLVYRKEGVYLGLPANMGVLTVTLPHP